MPEPVFMELGMYIMAPEHISMAYFINPSHQSAWLHVYRTTVARQRLGIHPIVARQRLGKKVTAATNTHAAIGRIVGHVVFMWPVSFQRRVCGSVCELLDVSVATNNC
jgi:hypothetical protein